MLDPTQRGEHLGDIFLLTIKNIDTLVSCDPTLGVQRHVDLCIDDNFISSIAPHDAKSSIQGEQIDGSNWIVFPGLVNTHHHFFQSFFRNRSEFGWTGSVLDWIARIYPAFAKLTEPCFYHTSMLSMSELIKYGCTTAFDHQYCFPKHAGKYLVDAQIQAAKALGMRFVAGRGVNTLRLQDGGNVPDLMVESVEDFTLDVERLVADYHDASPGSMVQIVAAPCQPMNCSALTFTRSLELAEAHDLRLHTHLGEGESPALQQRHGLRSLDWLRQLGFASSRLWIAHGWDLNAKEIDDLARDGIGVSHCPVPMALVGEAVTDVEGMLAAGVRVGIGVDGSASNDASNLAEALRFAYLSQCAVVKSRGLPPPQPEKYLRMATVDGALMMGRDDLGKLAVGHAADLFAIDKRRAEYAGATDEPESLPANVGISGGVDMTMINGQVVWRDGAFQYVDEYAVIEEATACMRKTLS